MATVFHPPHPNNMDDTAPSGYDGGGGSAGLDGDLDDMDTGPGDAAPVGGATGDQDDLPDFNAMGGKVTSPA